MVILQSQNFYLFLKCFSHSEMIEAIWFYQQHTKKKVFCWSSHSTTDARKCKKSIQFHLLHRKRLYKCKLLFIEKKKLPNINPVFTNKYQVMFILPDMCNQILIIAVWVFNQWVSMPWLNTTTYQLCRPYAPHPSVWNKVLQNIGLILKPANTVG